MTGPYTFFDQANLSQLPARSRTATIVGLKCGTSYSLYLLAANDFGESDRSEMLTAKTGGKPPAPPSSSNLLVANSSWVGLSLTSWDTGGCPISSFVVEYQPSGHPAWNLVSNNVKPGEAAAGGLFLISDLRPGTAYTLRMTAHNSAGSTVATFPFSTLDSEGALPSSMVNSANSPLSGWSLLGLLLLLSCVAILALGLASRSIVSHLLGPKLPSSNSPDPLRSPSLLPPPPPPLSREEAGGGEETEALFISSPFLPRESHHQQQQPSYSCYETPVSCGAEPCYRMTADHWRPCDDAQLPGGGPQDSWNPLRPTPHPQSCLPEREEVRKYFSASSNSTKNPGESVCCDKLPHRGGLGRPWLDPNAANLQQAGKLRKFSVGWIDQSEVSF